MSKHHKRGQNGKSNLYRVIAENQETNLTHINSGAFSYNGAGASETEENPLMSTVSTIKNT